MPNRNGTNQAKLENDLALAWKYLFSASTEYHHRGQDTAGDDLVDMAWDVRRRLEAELKRGGRLRTRPGGPR